MLKILLLFTFFLTLARLGIRINAQPESQSIPLNISSTNKQQYNATVNQIYGVRWAYGNAYGPDALGQYAILMFNFDQPYKQDISLKIGSLYILCSHEVFFFLDRNFTTTVYKCKINQKIENILNQNGSTKYQIVLQKALIQGEQEKTYIAGYSQQILFTAFLKLKTTQINRQILIINSQLINKQNDISCLNKTINDQQNINLIILTDGLGLQFGFQTYFQLLKNLEWLSSQFLIILIPNKSYSSDQYQLFTLTFFTPQWQRYYSSFSLIYYQNYNIALVQFNPKFSTENSSKIIEIDSNFQMLINQAYNNNFFNETFVIGFSQSSFLCSNSNCINKISKMSKYLSLMKKIGMDLQISGQNNNYERSFAICQDEILDQKDNQYNLSCPIYVNEGSKRQPLLKNYNQNITKVYSQKIGFGLITLIARFRQIPQSIKYSHFEVDICSNVDSFSFINQQTEQTQQPILIMGLTVRQILIIFQYSILLCVFIFLLVTCAKIIIKKRKKTTSGNDHIQMVEQVQNQQRNH